MDKYALGNFLAELRNEKGLTQEQLSEMINVNYKTISKWENGNSLPSLDTLTKLCEIYNVSLYEISIYKRIDNPLISKENIKKIINSKSITKFIFSKIIFALFTILLLIFIAYTFIYTINNYGQMAVYELKSENDLFDIDGLLVETNNKIYLLVSELNLLKPNDDYIKDTTKNLKYTLTLNDRNIETKNIKFENNTTIKKALSSINIYISKKKITRNNNILNISIRYENEIKKEKNLSFKIKLSLKHKNNKLFY